MGYPVPAGVSAAIAAYLFLGRIDVGGDDDIGDSRLGGLPSGCGDRIWGRYRQRWLAMRW